MDKIYVNIASSTPLPEQAEFSVRRVLHGLERRYLSLEAQSMVYCLLNSQSVPVSVTENAVQQAIVLGSMSGTAVDAQTFEVLFQAVTLNPAFRIPFSVATSLAPSQNWVC